jgi:hypothetical protein
LKFEPKVYVLLVIDMGYTTLSVYTYKCTREPNRALNNTLSFGIDIESKAMIQLIEFILLFYIHSFLLISEYSRGDYT